MALSSTLTSKGQTTIPIQVRKALRAKAGDRIAYTLAGDHVVLRRDEGAAGLAGALASNKGRGMSWAQIRAAAAKAAAGR